MGNVVVAAERLPKLEDYLCFAVYSANLPLHRLLKPLLDEVGLTYPQYLVLIALYDDDHQTVGGLGDKLFLDSSTLTPLLKRMEAMGYVVRQRDPQDERQVRIRWTPRGRSVREKGIGFRADYVETTDLMPAASRQLRQDMAKLRENLSKATQAIARRDPRARR
jgi:DNA-binding MarR family transcriptional regulator